MNIHNFLPQPVIPKAFTLPPQIIDLNFKLAATNINDGWDYGFDTVEISFVFDTNEMGNSSSPKMYYLDISDFENVENRKGYVIMADQKPYRYWQRLIEAEPGMEDTINGGIVNGRLKITPINDMGAGPTSSFLMPMKNLNFIDRFIINENPATLILAKYWHLFSLTPEEIFNRPKVMHIYLDVPKEDVLFDKALLNNEAFAVNMIGNWKETNQQMYRWIINENENLKLNENNKFIQFTEEETEFIDLLLDSINDIYRSYLNSNGLSYGEPNVFKIAVINPRNHNDSIIIYLMKGKRWEI